MGQYFLNMDTVVRTMVSKKSINASIETTEPKNFTLELNERVVTIGKTVNGNKVHANEVIVEKLEAVQEE